MIVLLSQKLNKKLWFSLVFIILVFILFTFYFFKDWLDITNSPNSPEAQGQEKNPKDTPSNDEAVSYDDIAQLIQEAAAHTNHYGIVDEDYFSDHVKQLICNHRRYRGWYMEYRQAIWHKKQANRVETSDGQFDSGGYSPTFSPLVENASTEDHSE